MSACGGEAAPVAAAARPRVRLEPLRPAHAAEMFTALGDERIYRYLDYGPPTSVAALQALYTRLQAGGSADGREVWLNDLVRLDTGTGTDADGDRADKPCGPAIGYVQATVLPGQHAWVAYVFDPRHWGRGLAHEAMQRFLARLHRDHPLPRWLAAIEADNARSAALLQRLGFAPARTDDPASERLYTRQAGTGPGEGA
jgi:[ribosomal protein S5]-alanine N-acetyltransferase